MSHCRLRRSLQDYVEGELPLDRALEFESHLPGCASCHAAVQAQRELDEALAALPRPRSAGPERERLLAAIAGRLDAPVAAGPRLHPWRRAAIAAGLLLLAGGGAFRLWDGGTGRRSTEPTVTTATQVATPIATDGTAPSGERLDPPHLEPSGEPTPRAPSPPPSLLAAPPFEVRLAAPRDELASIVRRLERRHAAAEGGDLLTTFLVEAQPLVDRGVHLATLLMALLHDEDAELAARAANLLADGAAAGALRRDEPGLIASLERALRRSDRGPVMVRSLAGIGTRPAYDAIARAATVPSVREPALAALAASGRRDVQGALTRALQEDLRAGAVGAARAERVVDALVLPHVEALRTLDEAARAGLRTAVVQAALQRSSTSALPLLATALRDGDDDVRQRAIELAPLTGARALAAPLGMAARQVADTAAALTALRRLGGVDALLALAQWRAADDPPRGNLALAERAFAAIAADLVASADDPSREADVVSSAIALAARSEPAVAAAFAEFALQTDGAAGPLLRTALLDHPLTPTALRARTALVLARAKEAFPRERVLLLLRAAADDTRDAAMTDDGAIAALLVLLYAQERDAALREGVIALGWPATPLRIARLAAAAQRILNERSIDRSVERLSTMRQLGP